MEYFAGSTKVRNYKCGDQIYNETRVIFANISHQDEI